MRRGLGCWIVVLSSVIASTGAVALAQAPEPPQTQQPAPPPPPQTQPPVDPSAEEAVGPIAPATDTQLLGLYGVIFSPWTSAEARRAAVDNPLLRDRRAVSPLTFLLLRDRDVGVRAAAATMLGRMPAIAPPLDQKVENALLVSARNQFEGEIVRVAAIEALVALGGPATGAKLRELYVSRDESQAIREAARLALVARWPEELEKQLPSDLDRSGSKGLIAGGALLGSYTLGAVGALGKNDAGTAIGIIGGGITGAVTASYLTRSGEITKAQAGWMVSAGVWGATLGMTAAASMQANPNFRFVLALGLLGEGAAFGAAAATRRGLRYSAADVGEFNTLGLLAADLAGGALLLAQPDDHRTSFGVMTAASVAGLATGLALAPSIKLTSRDGALIALAGYEGLWLGSLAPSAWFAPNDDEAKQTAGTVLGVGLGVGAGIVAAQHLELPERTVSTMWLFGSYGKLLGYSVPLLTYADNGESGYRDTRGVFLGSVGGSVAGALVANHLDIRQGDAALIALGTVVGGWHGLGLGLAADYSDREEGGLTALGTSVGGLASVGLSHKLKLAPSDVQALGGGLFWGTWFSAWSAALLDMKASRALRLTVAAGDAGMALSAVLVSPAVDLDPRRIGYAYLGGLSGAALFSLGAALATRDNDTLIVANLAGSGAGLAIGGLVASRLTLSPRTTRGARTAPSPTDGLSLRAPMLSPIFIPPPPGAAGPPTLGLGATFLE